MRKIDCYWYYEIHDMNARVPTCRYDREYGKCPCDKTCRHYISKEDVDNFIRVAKINKIIYKGSKVQK